MILLESVEHSGRSYQHSSECECEISDHSEQSSDGVKNKHVLEHDRDIPANIQNTLLKNKWIAKCRRDQIFQTFFIRYITPEIAAVISNEPTFSFYDAILDNHFIVKIVHDTNSFATSFLLENDVLDDSHE